MKLCVIQNWRFHTHGWSTCIHLGSERFKIDEPYFLATSKDMKFETFLSLPFQFLLLLFQHFCLSGSVYKGDMAQLSWSLFFVFFFWWSVSMVSGTDSSSMSTCLFFLLPFYKSGSLKTYMYTCIKYMYIKIMLLKYLHTKPKDWLSSQNYWNYLPQEHLDLRNLYSNTFLLKPNNLWSE